MDTYSSVLIGLLVVSLVLLCALCWLLWNRAKEFRDLNGLLMQQVQHFKQVARKHPVTGLPNRTVLKVQLGRILSEMKRGVFKTVSVVYLDLDNFKPVNDTYGHAAGDEVLRVLGTALHSTLRHSDVLAHLGGDEFVLVLPDSSIENAEHALSRALHMFRTSAFTEVDATCVQHVTFSWGMETVCSESIVDVDTLVKKADAKMYIAKHK